MKKYEDDILSLEIPTINHKADAISFIHEMVIACQDINGTGGLDGAKSYEEWLKDWEKYNTLEFSGYESETYVPAITFFVTRKTDNRIIGMLNIRKFLNKRLDATQGGNIGYSVRPSEQKKGYGKRLMKLAVEYCIEELGHNIIRAGCKELNIGSKKIIESVGMKEIERNEAIITHLYYELNQEKK